DVWHEADVALLDRLLDRAEHTPIPGLDHDLVRLRDADPRQLVERGLRAVVLHVDSLDEAGRGASCPDSLEVALHRLDCTSHFPFGRRKDLAAHREFPLALVISVPTRSPRATRVMFSFLLRSKTTIGRSF